MCHDIPRDISSQNVPEYMVRYLGEPVNTGFTPSTLNTDLSEIGFRLIEHLSPDDIQTRYFAGRTDGYYACEHAHLAWAVVE